MSSSWRVASLADSLRRAGPLAASLGVTRVTDITWLDRIGIPVFASVRPSAVDGSLCVNAGKGSTPDEARIGAIMEAIEFACAESTRSQREILQVTPRDISAQSDLCGDFVDLCPILGIDVLPDDPIDAVLAVSLTTRVPVVVPAELVFSPYPENTGKLLFGTSTNGLCSGNSLPEAALHGLCELIERDVLAFNSVRDVSAWVDPGDVPLSVSVLFEKVERAGMCLALRHTVNEFDLPFFQAFLSANDDLDPISISAGSALHLSAEIAAVRAITEAAQSRLTYIHGARDDLTDRADFFARQDDHAEQIATSRLLRRAFDRSRTVNFRSLASEELCPTVEEGLHIVLRRLAGKGMPNVVYADLSPKGAFHSVLKLIVPGLESFNSRVPRVGRRLVSAIERSN